VEVATILRLLSFCAAAVVLADCGQSQVSSEGIVPAGTIATKRAFVTPAYLRHRDLLYVADFNTVNFFSYGTWKPMGKLTGFSTDYPSLCVDAAQHVYVVATNEIFEYAHGGTTPMRTLSDPYGNLLGCSTDPTTGNLAVTSSASSGSIVSVYPHAKGVPVQYTLTITFGGVPSVAYDSSGNLFTDGYESSTYRLAELPKGSSSFMYFFFGLGSGSKFPNLGGMQWDGKYLAVGTYDSRPNIIEQVEVSSSGIAYKGTTTLERNSLSYGFFIVTLDGGSTVIATHDYHNGTGSCHTCGKMDVYRYPRGGSPTSVISGFDFPSSVAVSKATK
jgi:hypothetical protein